MPFNAKTRKSILNHTLFWLLYVVSEYVANFPHLEGKEHFQQIRATVLAMPIVMLPTYFMIGFVIPKYLVRKKWGVFVGYCIGTGVLVLFARVQWLEMVNRLNFDFHGAMPVSKVLKNAIRDYAIIALAICIYIIADWRNQGRKNEALIKAKAQSDLTLLKRQLHPHFLFNTLNNIYSLSLNNSKRTTQSILMLSDLLEYLVYRSEEKNVPLTDEIKLAKNYIALEKLRFGKQLEVNFEAHKVNHVKTAPLLLLPFIENCFKHGGKNEKGTFWIQIKIKGFDHRLLFSIKNSKPAQKSTEYKKSGVGLKNIRSRLDLLYENRYKLEIADSVNHYAVSLMLDLSHEK